MFIRFSAFSDVFGRVRMCRDPFAKLESLDAFGRALILFVWWEAFGCVSIHLNFGEGWMYVCMYGWMNGWMDGWMHACMHAACMHACMHEWMDGWMNG